MRAEKALRENVRRKFPDRDEEIITELFHAELEAEFARVSNMGVVAGAFLSDLKQSFSSLDPHELRSKIARGIIGTINFHPRHVEKETGGDFGIVLVRPDVQESRFGWSNLTIDGNYQRGLLCQAKIFRRDSRWERFTPTQKRLLATKLKYFTLLLYRYVDQKEQRRELAAFMWQQAGNAAAPEVNDWLASGQFPNPENSQKILGALIRNQIGTDVRRLIEKDIAPPLRPSLVIKIGWRDGNPPAASVRVRHRSSAVSRQQVLQRHY